jgi:hypothetical protein
MSFVIHVVAGVRLENFGSFVFLFAVGCRGCKNTNVPKYGLAGVDESLLCLCCLSMLARHRVSDNVLQIGDGRAFQHKS